MTLAGPWLLAAMSENGAPSARRFTLVMVMCVYAPLLLTGMMRWAPAGVGECFFAFIAGGCGAYVGGSFAGRGRTPSAPPAGAP